MNRKITEKQAEEVRQLYNNKISVATIAALFKISQSRVYQLLEHKAKKSKVPVVYSSGDW